MHVDRVISFFIADLLFVCSWVCVQRVRCVTLQLWLAAAVRRGQELPAGEQQPCNLGWLSLLLQPCQSWHFVFGSHRLQHQTPAEVRKR